MNRPLPRRVLVTGATGFLGLHVCRALLDRGAAVRGLTRRPGSSLLQGVEPWPVQGLDDVPALRRALSEVDAVVHLAAHVHQDPASSRAATAAFRMVNVDGTRTLLDAAIAAGVRTFVFASSIKAVGEHSTEPWTESVVPAPADAYGRTKLEAEQLIADRAATAGLHAPILRLPLVYGAGMKANMLRLFDTVDRDIPLPFGAVCNRRSLLYAGNLVAALLGTLESPAGSGTFFVSDDDDMSTPELVCAIAEALGRRARLLRVPVAILRAGGRAGDVLARLGRFPLTTSALDRVVGSLAVDCSRLKRLTGYAPPFRARDGLRVTADWYRHTRRTTQ